MSVDKLVRDEVSVAGAIVRVLEEAGIDLIFGIPGGRTGAIFDALYDYATRFGPSWFARKAWRRSWPTCTAA